MKKSIVRVALSLTLLAGASAALSACNTISGAGKDVSSAGHGVSRGADDTKAAIHKNL
ncbi:entericidin A/B family lipoprotein [Swingsia samuiensis]|nr:entericidin A/B family lipoprotein [Swingsia samuiensis]